MTDEQIATTAEPSAPGDSQELTGLKFSDSAGRTFVITPEWTTRSANLLADFFRYTNYLMARFVVPQLAVQNNPEAFDGMWAPEVYRGLARHVLDHIHLWHSTTLDADFLLSDQNSDPDIKEQLADVMLPEPDEKLSFSLEEKTAHYLTKIAQEIISEIEEFKKEPFALQAASVYRYSSPSDSEKKYGTYERGQNTSPGSQEEDETTETLLSKMDIHGAYTEALGNAFIKCLKCACEAALGENNLYDGPEDEDLPPIGSIDHRDLLVSSTPDSVHQTLEDTLQLFQDLQNSIFTAPPELLSKEETIFLDLLLDEARDAFELLNQTSRECVVEHPCAHLSVADIFSGTDLLQPTLLTVADKTLGFEHLARPETPDSLNLSALQIVFETLSAGIREDRWAFEVITGYRIHEENPLSDPEIEKLFSSDQPLDFISRDAQTAYRTARDIVAERFNTVSSLLDSAIKTNSGYQNEAKTRKLSLRDVRRMPAPALIQ